MPACFGGQILQKHCFDVLYWFNSNCNCSAVLMINNEENSRNQFVCVFHEEKREKGINLNLN